MLWWSYNTKLLLLLPGVQGAPRICPSTPPRMFTAPGSDSDFPRCKSVYSSGSLVSFNGRRERFGDSIWTVFIATCSLAPRRWPRRLFFLSFLSFCFGSFSSRSGFVAFESYPAILIATRSPLQAEQAISFCLAFLLHKSPIISRYKIICLRQTCKEKNRQDLDWTHYDPGIDFLAWIGADIAVIIEEINTQQKRSVSINTRINGTALFTLQRQRKLVAAVEVTW